MSKIIPPNDAAFFLLEKPASAVHVGAMAIFDLPEDAPEDFLQNLVARWRKCTTFAAPFNYRLKMLPLPSWEVLPDHAIDLDYHFRHSALPAPGGERELGVLISRLHTHLLDRKRPLWECHLIEGLGDNQFALYTKLHHSQIDGVGGIRMFQNVFPADANARDIQPLWSVGMPKSGKSKQERPNTGEKISGFIRQRADNISALTRRFSTLNLDMFRRPEGKALPFLAPKSVLNRRIGAARRIATQQYSVARMKAVAKQAESTLNDIFLAISAAALRRYLLEIGELPNRSLTALVPVSIRPADDASTGNAISFILANLHTEITDPVKRLHAIHRSVDMAKGELEPLPKSALSNYTVMMMGPFMSQVALGATSVGPPMFNVTVSNVPGPRETRYLDGAPMQAMYPVSFLFGGQALNISVVSYADTFNLGFTGCRDSLPHMQRLAVYTGEALDELEQALASK